MWFPEKIDKLYWFSFVTIAIKKEKWRKAQELSVIDSRILSSCFSTDDVSFVLCVLMRYCTRPIFPLLRSKSSEQCKYMFSLRIRFEKDYVEILFIFKIAMNGGGQWYAGASTQPQRHNLHVTSSSPYHNPRFWWMKIVIGCKRAHNALTSKRTHLAISL